MPKYKPKGNPIIKQLREQLNETNMLNGRLAQLLQSTADALKGDPGPLTLHDWSDLPEVARGLRGALERSREHAATLEGQLDDCRSHANALQRDLDHVSNAIVLEESSEPAV